MWPEESHQIQMLFNLFSEMSASVQGKENIEQLNENSSPAELHVWDLLGKELKIQLPV